MLDFFSYQIMLEKYVLFSNPNMKLGCIDLLLFNILGGT